jgi:CHAT domain-containing protein/Tfp pilus assembly protein PilF
MLKFILSCFLLIIISNNSYAQNSRLKDSVKLDSLINLMYEQNGKQNFDSAIVYAKEIIALTLTLYDSTSIDYAIGVRDLGYLYNANFDFVNAELYDKKAIALLEKIAGKNDAEYATAINNLGAVYEDLGVYSAADSLYKESSLIRKRIYGDTSEEYAESLNNLGNFYRKTENYDLAKTNLEQSILIRQKSKDSLYAQTLNTLGLTIQKTGNYALAEKKYKEALAVIDSCCGKIIEYWNISNNLAALYFDMSNYKAAENIHKAVLAHILDQFHKKIVDYATTLNSLAQDYNAASEYDSALYCLKEASGILLNELGDNHPDYATSLNVIATTYERKGEPDSAQLYYEDVLKIRKQNFGVNSPLYAEAVNNLGLIYLKKKDYKNAEINFNKAAEIRLAALGKEHPDYTESITNLLNVYYAENNYNQWANALNTAIDIWKSSTMHLLLSFGEKEKQTYLDNHLSQRDLFLSMLWYFNQQHKTDSLHAAYFKMVTALQGWLLSGSQELNKLITQKKDTALQALYNKWLAAKNKYAQAIQMNEAEQKKLNLNADSLLQASGDLEKTLIENLPELLQSLNNTAIAPSKISQQLNADETLINWVSFKYKNPESWTDSVLYAAFIISPKDSTAKFVTAFEQTALKDLLTHYFNYSGRGVVVKTSKTKKNIGTDLYKMIWQPILPYIQNADKVYIIPSGLLNKISFQSLEDTTQKTLLETSEVHLLNNVNELRNNSIAYSNKTIGVIGGAAFDSTATGEYIPSNKNAAWHYLKGSKEEAMLLADMFTKNNRNPHLYTEKNASEENFKSFSGNNSPDILHIATHGFYLPGDSNKRFLNYPLLRSGFVLSGANLYWNNDTASLTQQDGIVTAQEISNLNFNNTKLLTLSACETALGDINNNEGVYGLQRAFKIAGVKEMLITLWQIPDKETKELMQLFYANILKGDSYYNALKKAQLQMKANNPDPAIWAGFELIGE